MPDARAVHSQRMQEVKEGTSDEALLSDAAYTPSAALAELYDRHSAMLYGMALRMTGSAHEAEMLVLRTFERIWEERSSFDRSKGRLPSYMLCTMRTLALESGLCRSEVLCGSGFHTLANELPTELRAVFTEYHLNGTPDTELAVSLGLPVALVRERARAALCQIVQLARRSLQQRPCP
jgi:DNA-directed RNA polymerase specialized sigma24 family protein